MAFVPPKDRVLEHSTTAGTGPYALPGAGVDTSYNAFNASMAVGDTTLGAIIEPGVAFAVGLLTYSAANQITLTTTYDSKGTFGSGTKEIMMGLPASRAVYTDRPAAFTSNVSVGGTFGVTGASTLTGALAVNDTTASTSSTTGALKVAGGLGVVGNGYFGGLISSVGGNSIISSPTNGVFALSVKKTNNSADDLVMAVAGGPTGSDTTALIYFYDGPQAGAPIGSIRRSGTGVAYNISSDERLKPNRKRLSLDYARSIVDALEIYDYDFEGNELRGIGVLAQQAFGVHKSLGMPGRTPNEPWMAEKAAPAPFLVANVQQVNARLDAIEKRLA